MREKMSDIKVYATDEQPCVAEGGGQHNAITHQNGHRPGCKCSRGPPHQCPGPGRNIKRQDKEREGEENEGKNTGNKQEKKKGGENRRREKVKMSQV